MLQDPDFPVLSMTVNSIRECEAWEQSNITSSHAISHRVYLENMPPENMSTTNKTIRHIFKFLMAPSPVLNQSPFARNYSTEDIIERAIARFQGTVHNPLRRAHFTQHSVSTSERVFMTAFLLGDPILGKIYKLMRDIMMSSKYCIFKSGHVS